MTLPVGRYWAELPRVAPTRLASATRPCPKVTAVAECAKGAGPRGFGMITNRHICREIRRFRPGLGQRRWQNWPSRIGTGTGLGWAIRARLLLRSGHPRGPRGNSYAAV